ncbi:MAG: transketolase [Trueperaceae bacterium]
MSDIDRRAIDTLRTLAIDAVQQANSGHPGTPMGAAPVAYELWQHALRYDPADPAWPDRDRFVLSAGHASTLLYALLHLTGVRALDGDERPLDEPAVSLDDLRRFRQLGSRTPGHPEYRHTAGVETTSGPLGQGVSNAVGMALAQRWLAATFNRPGFAIVDHDVVALAGDGDMMEGVSSEAASLAAHLGLDRLCWIYDRNRITIEGGTELAFSEDVAARFRAYGWSVLHVEDANDTEALGRALATFRATEGRPTLIVVDSHIGYGAPHKQDTAAAHGEPLGAEEVRLAKRAYGWPEDAQFLVPDEVRSHFAEGIGRRGAQLRAAWNDTFAAYRAAHPELAADFERLQRRELPDGWDADLPAFPADARGVASRDASGKALNAIAGRVPWLVGGAADLAPSTKTRLTFEGAGDQSAAEPGGRNLHFGVREHAMGAILNGLALSKVRPFGAGFLIFSDYARPTLRLAALMRLPVIHVFTHDSIGVGEDGPTHQPIEQLASLRAIPGLTVLRPADANEVAEAWRWIMPQKDAPVALLLSRQALPTFDRARTAPAAGLARGAYVLADAADGDPEVLLLASGSEVSLCLEAHERLAAEGIRSRVVSMPSWELFEAQDPAYRDAVLPPAITARVAVEQAAPFGWERYVGLAGRVVGMRGYGASAPLPALLEHFGFTVDAVVAAAKEAR